MFLNNIKKVSDSCFLQFHHGYERIYLVPPIPRFNIVYKLVQENGDLLLLNTLQEDQSNWMIFVRAAEQKSEQNLVAFQYRGEIFFATIKVSSGVSFANTNKGGL